LPAVIDRRHADRHAEREQLLVGHLARHGLAVQAPALGDEEVAGVDDLLHLAERLGVGLADLARDEAGQRLLVVLDEASGRAVSRGRATGAGVAAHSAARPGRARQASTNASASAELDLGDHVVEVGGVAGLSALSGGAWPCSEGGRLPGAVAESEHHRVAIIGAGFSGLGMAIRLRQEGIDDFVVIERASEIGGTWRDNTYPGCQCDIPSVLYSYSFAPNPNWTRTYPLQEEIRDYLRRCAAEFGVLPFIRFEHEVLSATWEKDRAAGGSRPPTAISRPTSWWAPREV
jgi:hypothetical protein